MVIAILLSYDNRAYVHLLKSASEKSIFILIVSKNKNDACLLKLMKKFEKECCGSAVAVSSIQLT